MAKTPFYIHSSFISVYMRMTTDIINRANARTMARDCDVCREDSFGNVLSDGSIEVSVQYNGEYIRQRLTPEQLEASFEKALTTTNGKEIQ